MLKTSRASFAAALTLSLVAAPAMAKSKDHITGQEDQLLAAGFEARPANTPERQAMLASLPKQKFFRRVNGENVAYLYADPVHCNCLYVGTQQAYGTYRATMQQAQIARDQLNAAEAYQDSNWNWGPWGPWDGPWDGFGFWPNRGW